MTTCSSGGTRSLSTDTRFTKDPDLWVRDHAENIARAVDALERFGAPEVVLEGLRSAEGLDVVWMGLPPSRIDLMKAVPGGDFDSAWPGRLEISLDGVRIHVIPGVFQGLEDAQATSDPQARCASYFGRTP